jgi:hypothetical protein
MRRSALSVIRGRGSRFVPYGRHGARAEHVPRDDGRTRESRSGRSDHLHYYEDQPHAFRPRVERPGLLADGRAVRPGGV